MRGLVAVLVLLAAPLIVGVESAEPTAPVPGLEHTLLNGVSLKGLRACCADDGVPGLTNERIQAAAEARLEAAGIVLDSAGQASLFIPTRIVARESCFVTVEWSLVEYARLERNELLVPVQSRTGGGSMLADTALDECADQVIAAVERAVDDFAALHDAMNGQPWTP